MCTGVVGAGKIKNKNRRKKRSVIMAINSLSSSSHGLSGLASGMDTQSMVDALLKGTQSKIDNTKSKKAQLTYKQEMYRSVSAQLRAFKSSFFEFTGAMGDKNMYSSSFFNTMAAKSSSSAFKITANTNSKTGITNVDYIKQLARATSKKSANAATAGLEGTFNAKSLELAKEAVKTSMDITVGDKKVTIDDVNLLIAGKGNAEAAEILNTKFAELFKGMDKTVKAVFENGAMSFTATGKDGVAEAIKISGTGTRIFGATDQTTIGSESGIIKSKFNLSVLNPKLSVDLNGVKKDISFSYNSKNAGEVVASLQSSLDKAFGPEIVVNNTGDKISLSTKSSSSQIILQGPNAVMDALGIKNGQSNKINTDMYLKNINFKENLSGKNQSFKINGVDFNVTTDRTLGSIMNEINNSDANVKISYSRSDDKFVIEAKQSGAGVGITMSQTEGNLLSALFGSSAVAGGNSVGGEALTAHADITGSYDAANFLKTLDTATPPDPLKSTAFVGGSVMFNVNGKNLMVNLAKNEKKDVDGKPILDAEGKPVYEEYTAASLAAAVNKDLETEYGKDANGVANVSLTVGKDGANNDILTIKSSRDYNVTVTSSETARLLGFKADASTDSAAKGTTKLSELGLGADFAMNLTIGTGANKQSLKLTLADFGGENGTVESMQAAINTSLRAAEATSTEVPKPKPGTYGTAAFDDPPGRFRLFGVDIPMEIAVTGENSKALFAGDKLSLGNGAMSTDANAFLDTAGQNAVLSVNGVEVERNSNVFTYDDLSFELLATTRKDDASGNPIPETITVTRDTDQIYDGLKKFVDEYNKVVESINKLLSAEPSYKEYAPLTSEQRKSMSESEAKTWDEKSKEGLLRRDPALEAVMTDMRGLLYSKPKDSNIALYEMGIKTYMSYEPLDAGKITLSNAGADLKKMIAERPDDVAKLFLSEQGGLSKGMMDVIDRASLVSITKPGTLVSIAGSSNTDTSSNIYKQMKNINDSLDTLERTYTTEYNRYWKQFNTMESMIQNMNTQSSWLTQQLGGS